MPKKDCWASWLERTRSLVDRDSGRTGYELHAAWRDRILDNAALEEGETLLDVGCGEGLVALGALARGAGRVVFSDISDDVLDSCREAATAAGALDRCEFVNASAEDLGVVEDGSVDVVTTRSVLIYVPDKQHAFEEFARVLRAGGRVSLFEPINRFSRRGGDTWMGYDVAGVSRLASKLRGVYEAIQPPDSDPMLDFDERDLLALAERAGFASIRLELEAEVRTSAPMPWETFVATAGNPRIPALRDAMDQALTPAEREELTAYLRPLVEEGRGTSRAARAFISATKP